MTPPIRLFFVMLCQKNILLRSPVVGLLAGPTIDAICVSDCVYLAFTFVPNLSAVDTWIHSQNILVTSNSGQQALPQPHRPVEPRRTIPHVQINQQLAVWASSTVTAQPQIHQLTWSEIEQRFNYSFSLERETLALST
eukprot:m.610947 g.610947  ORF g.610947 m.610947 type:complete len:138 (-) comp22495_c0_seq24:2530-2943(-)